MSPGLALLACTVFVLFLLRLERMPSRGVSLALWIPTLWFLMISSRSLGAWFGTAVNNEAGSLLDEVMLSGLTMAGVAVLIRRRFNWSEALWQQKWLMMLLVYMFASALWSNITLLAMRRWVREVIVIVMVFVVASDPKPRKALASLMRRTAFVLIPLSLVLIKYYPALGRQYARWSGVEMWAGAPGHKNGLGRLCLISILFLLWSLYRRWRGRANLEGPSPVWADVSVISLAAYLLQGANSSTSVATLAVGIAVFVGLRLLRKLKIIIPQVVLLSFVAFFIGFGVSAPFLGGSNVAIFSSSLGRDDTLTGRTEVWTAVLPAWGQRPVFGYGFGSFWTDARRELYEIPTAHNGYLEVSLELGAVGLGFYTIWLLSCARQLQRALKEDYDWASLTICFLLMGLVYNATESALNTFTEQMTAVIVLTSIIVPTTRRVRRRCSSAVAIT